MTGQHRALTAATLALLHDGAACGCHGSIAIQQRPGYVLGPGTCCDRCRTNCCRPDRNILFSVVLGMVNSGWSSAEGADELHDRANFGGRHIQQLAARNRARANSELQRTWRRATTIVQQNPMPRGPHERIAVLIAIGDIVETRPEVFSRGQAGVTERAVIRALIAEGIKSSSTTVPCSELDMVMLIQCAQKTARAAFKRLRESGLLLELHVPRTRTEANVWRLKVPRLDRVTPQEVATATDRKEINREVKVSPVVGRIFGPDGLGRATAETLARIPLFEQAVTDGVLVAARQGETFESVRRAIARSVDPGGMPLLVRGPPVSRTELALALNRSTKTISRHLKRLDDAKVIRMVAGRYYRVACTAAVVADDLGVPHTDLLRAEKVRRQRIGWYEHLVEKKLLLKKDSSDGPTYVEPKSGRVIKLSYPDNLDSSKQTSDDIIGPDEVSA